MQMMLVHELAHNRQQALEVIGETLRAALPIDRGDVVVGRSKRIRYRTTLLPRGHLRQNGTIRVNGGPEEPIFAPHLKPYEEEVYVGATHELDKLFKGLCDQADAQLVGAVDLDAKLKAIVYMQLWGSSTLHPFVDGNGRTFGAKMVLDLNRIGFRVDAIPGLPELADLEPKLEKNFLATLGPKFTQVFLENEGIDLVPKKALQWFLESPDLYKEYMRQLSTAIRVGFQAGLEPQGYVGEYLGFGAFLLKLALSRDGHIERSFYDERIEKFVQFQRGNTPR